MTEKDIKKEVLEYLDRLIIGCEILSSRDSRGYIEAINKEVEEYKEKLYEEHKLVLKRK